ncbi:cytidylyltransferase domain-containing protein [Roseivirga sp. E12]|uniref:cytidylyltransferase domain-containing protein n=1 Tax=Roseivirga sp. E12 TaxID=2819237 RepID=UPI001ABC7A2A|nr:glycosyltransferase family protein [Roseivirga sp. E12]MBO3698383.1 glycosyltransferase family protein [Roseivirga sp. E12]
MEKVKTIAITQARVGSSRLPSKVLLPIGNQTLLDIHLKRLTMAQKVDQVVVATTNEDRSDEICIIAERCGTIWFKGSLDDVLDRFYQAAILHKPDWVVRVTSDCPLIDPELVDAVVELAIQHDYDYCSNVLVQDFPDGQDIEVFKMSTLEKAWNEAVKRHEREHVTPYIWSNCDFNGGELFTSADLPSPGNYNAIRMTVDEAADLEVMTWLVEALGIDKPWFEYTQYLIAHPERAINSNIIRNEGYLKSLKNEKDE